MKSAETILSCWNSVSQCRSASFMVLQPQRWVGLWPLNITLINLPTFCILPCVCPCPGKVQADQNEEWLVGKEYGGRQTQCIFMNRLCVIYALFSQLILQQIYQLLSELEKNQGFHFMQQEEDTEQRHAAEKARSVCRKTGLHQDLSWLILTSSIT